MTQHRFQVYEAVSVNGPSICLVPIGLRAYYRCPRVACPNIWSPALPMDMTVCFPKRR
jgi:hypothetical protein